MTVDYMDVLDREGQIFPLLTLDRTRDALAAYCAARWPVGRRKGVEKEWDLSPDEARSVCRGTASQLTIDKVLMHQTRGRWHIAFPLFGALFQESAAEFIAAQRRKNVETAARLRSVGRDLRALGPSLGSHDPQLGSGLGQQRARQRGRSAQPANRRSQ